MNPIVPSVKVQLVPTQGAYQKPIDAFVVGETKTWWFAHEVGNDHVQKFRKSDRLHANPHYWNQFPCRRLTFPT